MGRFNFDVEDSTPTPPPPEMSSQRMRLDYTPVEPVETEWESKDALLPRAPSYEPELESASRPGTDEDDDALIDQATREKLERAKAVTLNAAKLAGKHSRNAAQLSARLARAGTAVATNHVGKALAYRPSAAFKNGALAVLVLSIIAALAYGAWHYWPESTETAPAPVEALKLKPSPPAPAVTPQPKAGPEPVADPADVLAGELGTGPSVASPAVVQTPIKQEPKPEAVAPLKAAPGPAQSTKPKQPVQPKDKSKPKDKADEKEWAEKANADLDGFFDQLNQQEPKK